MAGTAWAYQSGNEGISSNELQGDEVNGKDKGEAMTEKQQRFIKEYLKCLNGSKAARRAGYSVKCAFQQAYENMLKPKIRSVIDQTLEARHQAWEAEQERRIAQQNAKVMARLHRRLHSR